MHGMLNQRFSAGRSMRRRSEKCIRRRDLLVMEVVEYFIVVKRLIHAEMRI